MKFQDNGRLAGEIKRGLTRALQVGNDEQAIRKTLTQRKQENLADRYNDLAVSERFFMEAVDIPVDWSTIDPIMHWVETDREARIWDYARNIVSSMPENSVIGRQMRYYFKDAHTGRWLGIVCLASALTVVSPRHKRMRWDTETRFKNLAKIMNIAVCVPIQPFGTLCGGKLLFVSALTNEVRAKYEEKYGDPLLALETTSLYGKSSQYNRVKEYEYLGLTKGSGNIHVSDELWSKIKQYLELHPEHGNIGGSSVKMRSINTVAKAVGLSKDASNHGHQRGYYWGVTANNSEAILRGDTDEDPDWIDYPLDEMTDWWRGRWYEMRLPKKQDAIEEFDSDWYALDNHVPKEHRRERQMYLV